VTRFKFRLARVLHARRAAEQLQRAELAAAENRARRAEATAGACTDAVHAARNDVARAQSAPSLDAAWVLVSHDAETRLMRVEENLHALASAERERVAGVRGAWRALRTDVRGLERLEARGRERVREKVASDEERAIEEFAARQAEERRRKGTRR